MSKEAKAGHVRLYFLKQYGIRFAKGCIHEVPDRMATKIIETGGAIPAEDYEKGTTDDRTEREIKADAGLPDLAGTEEA